MTLGQENGSSDCKELALNTAVGRLNTSGDSLGSTASHETIRTNSNLPVAFTVSLQPSAKQSRTTVTVTELVTVSLAVQASNSILT